MKALPLHLMRHPHEVSIVRLPAGAEISWDLAPSAFSSVTRTSHETSVICESRLVPAEARREGPYVPFEVAGPLDFALVGIMAGILAPVVAARISILTMSTFDTDWVLVPVTDADAAAEAWRRHGFVVTPTSLSDWHPAKDDS